MKNWKFLLTIILIIFLTFSCTKTAADIDVSKITDPCECIKDQNLVTNEYYNYVVKSVKAYEAGVDNPENFRNKFEKKRIFYDNLLQDLFTKRMEMKWDPKLRSFDNCKDDLWKNVELEGTYRGIYDTLLLKISPNYVAESYLKALMDKDYQRAKFFSDSGDYDNIDMMKELKMDFGLSEVKNVNCEVKDNRAFCSFCCTADTMWKDMRLSFDKGHWIIQPAKDEVPPP